jgi:hypothetical protein
MIIKEFLVSLGAQVDLTELEKGLRSADRMAAQFGKSWIAQFAAAGAAVTALSVTASAGILKLAGGVDKVIPEVNALKESFKTGTEWIRKYLQENLAVPLAWIRKSLKDGNENFQKNKEKILKGIGDLMLHVVRFGATIIRGATDVGRIIGRVLRGIPPEITLIGGALAGLGLILKTGPLGIAMAIFSVLILLLDDFYTYLDGGKSLFGDKWEFVIEWGKKLKEFFKDAKEGFRELREKISAWWDSFNGSDLALDIWESIKDLFKNIGDFIGNVLEMWSRFSEKTKETGQMTKFTDALGGLAGGFLELVKAVLDGVNAFFDFLNMDLDNNGLSDLADVTLPALLSGFEALTPVVEAISGAFKLIANAIQVIISALKGDWSGVNTFGNKMLTGFVDMVLPKSLRSEWLTDVLASAGLAEPVTTTSTAQNTQLRGNGGMSATAAGTPAQDSGSAKPVTQKKPTTRATKQFGVTAAFAEGGVVQKPTFALIGEAGPEVVINPKKPNALSLVMQALQMPGLKDALEIGRANYEMVTNASTAQRYYSQNVYNNALTQNTANSTKNAAYSTQTDPDQSYTAQNLTSAAYDQRNYAREDTAVNLTVNTTNNIYGSGNAKETADAINKNTHTTLIRNLKGVLA